MILLIVSYFLCCLFFYFLAIRFVYSRKNWSSTHWVSILFRSLLAYLLSHFESLNFCFQRTQKVNEWTPVRPHFRKARKVCTLLPFSDWNCARDLFIYCSLLYQHSYFSFVCSGACKPYHGSVCSKFIPGDDRIFIALNNSQQQNEERILLAASILRDYTHSNCKDSLVKFLCFHLFPRCHGGKHPKPRYLCKDDCEVLQAATCSREFHLLERRLGTSAHRTIPDCSSLSDRGNCLSIGKWFAY